MRHQPFLPAILATFLCLISVGLEAVNAAPVAPSNLRVKPLGVNSFLLEWNDNSTDEVGWDVRVSLGGVPTHFMYIATPNITSYVVFTNPLQGKDLFFQIASYSGASGTEDISSPTSIIKVTALSPTRFDAPTSLVATAVDDGQIRITWKDNSTSENGYQMEYRASADTKWLAFGSIQAGITFSVASTGFAPSTSYSFRVRAYKENPLVFTAYSNVAETTTKPVQSPTNLVVKTESDGAFSFKWKDNSSLEAGFELQSKKGTDDFLALGTVSTNTTSTGSVSGFALDTDYQFRVRSFRTVATETVYTDFTNVVSAKSTKLATPSNFAESLITDTSIDLTWKDISERETQYDIDFREDGTTSYTTNSVGPNTATYVLTELRPGILYDIRLRAVDSLSGGNSSYTPVLKVRTKDGFFGTPNPPIFFGTSFLYNIQISRLSALANLTVSNVPGSLVYNSSARTISGTPAWDGVKTISLKATFNDGSIIKRSLVLRVIRPPAAPIVTHAFGSVSLAVAATSTLSVTGKFADPDTTRAIRLNTSRGKVDIILYPLATPLTVTNFLNYMDAGRYNHMFFHRSVADTAGQLFIVQGGGYRYTPTQNFTRVPKFPTVQNEPGISNRAGTIAMAKVGGDPNSANSEFFVNIDDANASNLDAQNGGFTVFGRVADPGMTIMAAVNALPVKNYSVIIGTGTQSLTDVPVTTATSAIQIEPDYLVKVPSLGPAPILTYKVLSADMGVATAHLSGTNITITAVAVGITTIHVTATDLDGQTVTQDIAVKVQ